MQRVLRRAAGVQQVGGAAAPTRSPSPATAPPPGGALTRLSPPSARAQMHAHSNRIGGCASSHYYLADSRLKLAAAEL